MTIYNLKPAFQNLLRPMCRALAAAGITANQVTIAAMALSVLLGIALTCFAGSQWVPLLVPAWLFLRMAFNAIDGMLAREHGMKSAVGGMLNELGDVVSDAALYLPFALLEGIRPELIVAVVVLAILTEMAGVVAVQIGATRRYDGPMGKSDRAFVFGLLALLIGLRVPLGWWVNLALAVVAALTAWTIIRRAHRALAEVAAGGAGDGGQPR